MGESMSAQLDIFETEDITLLKEDMRKVKETSENVRKGVFSRLTNLEKAFLEKYVSQEKRIGELEEVIFNLYKGQ